MRDMIRVSLMLLTAGCVPAFCVIAAICTLSITDGTFSNMDVPTIWLVTLALCLLGLVLAFLIIMPAFAFLYSRGKLNGWTALLVGSIEGLAPILALSYFHSTVDGIFSVSTNIALWAELPTLCGAFTGWLVWRLFDEKPISPPPKTSE